MNWTLKLKNKTPQDFTTFPAAYKALVNLIQRATDNKEFFDTVGVRILGPKDSRGDRVEYTYPKAKEMADAQGLYNDNGRIDKRAWRESNRFMEE